MLYESSVFACMVFLYCASAFYLTMFLREVLLLLGGRKIGAAESSIGGTSRDYEGRPLMGASRIKILIEKYAGSYTATAFDNVGHVTSATSNDRDKAISRLVKKLGELDYDVTEETLTIEDMNP